jgi:hypothetical protein
VCLSRIFVRGRKLLYKNEIRDEFHKTVRKKHEELKCQLIDSKQNDKNGEKRICNCQCEGNDIVQFTETLRKRFLLMVWKYR